MSEPLTWAEKVAADTRTCSVCGSTVAEELRGFMSSLMACALHLEEWRDSPERMRNAIAAMFSRRAPGTEAFEAWAERERAERYSSAYVDPGLPPSRLITDGSWRGSQCQLHTDCAAADAQACNPEFTPQPMVRAAHLPYPARWAKSYTQQPGDFVDVAAGI